MTIAFPDREETVLVTQMGFSGVKYPVPMPPKTEIIDIAQQCADDAYRGTDFEMA